MIRTALTTVVAALLGWSLVLGAPAHAAFSRVATAAPVYGSATLQPPATASATCTAGPSSSTATVSWTATPSTFVTGYRITSSPASQTLNTTAAARSQSVTGLTKGGKYTFTVVATYRNWTSTARTTALVTC